MELISIVGGLISLLVGGGYAIWQYQEKVQNDRVHEVFAFLDRLERPPVSSARQEIEQVWSEKQEELKRQIEDNNLDKDAYCRYITKIVRETNLTRSINSVLEFYDRLQTCVDTFLCDKPTAP